MLKMFSMLMIKCNCYPHFQISKLLFKPRKAKMPYSFANVATKPLDGDTAGLRIVARLTNHFLSKISKNSRGKFVHATFYFVEKQLVSSPAVMSSVFLACFRLSLGFVSYSINFLMILVLVISRTLFCRFEDLLYTKCVPHVSDDKSP